MFFALIARGIAPDEAAQIVSQVLGEVSPATGDSSLGTFAMIVIMLTALGVAAFAIRKATKEMAK